MKKIVFILVIILFLCGCSQSDNREMTPPPTEAAEIQSTESVVTATIEPTLTPEPTPVQPVKSLALPINLTDYQQFLTRINLDETPNFVTEMETSITSLISPEDDAYYVEFNPDRMNNLQLDRPNMPTYSWTINGSNADKIAEVVIEFDLLETIHPLHPGFFGYDKGYFITLHHFQIIPNKSPWQDVVDFDENIRTDIDRFEFLETPEYGEDLRKYAEEEDKHVKITIPYSEFQSTAKDLTLQFLPGTTFANLSISLWGSNELNSDTLAEISKPVELPERDLLHDVILPILQISEDNLNIPYSETETRSKLEELMWSNDIIADGHAVNPDGSVNMPIAFYDLGEYTNEVQGKYAVVPEGLVPAFMTLSSYSYLGGSCSGDLQQLKKDKRALIDFTFENMMDETGQFFGVYDIEQGKMVATNRKSPALPILSAMLINKSIWSNPLSNEEIDFIVNSIIANDLIRVGDKLYYAPNGISEDGIMQLNLSDFAFSNELFEVFMEYSNDRSRLDVKYGSAMLLEGYTNSLRLILEAQEQNMTRLPSSELKVVFKNDGKSYELQPSDTFEIVNNYFFVAFRSNEQFGLVDNGLGAFSELSFEKSNYSSVNNLSGGKDGIFSEAQKQFIRKSEAQYAEAYDAYTITTLLYNSMLNIYNFLQAQPSETAYAPRYNVHTGEMIEASADTLEPEFSWFAPMIKRFGTPATSLGYHLLVGMFNDEKPIRESAHLVMNEYTMYLWEIIGPQSSDYSNPDLFADNGFNVWGYDSMQFDLGPVTSMSCTWALYGKVGLNFNREDWKEFTMRKVNERTTNEKDLISLDDDFPLFYDDFPETVFAD